MRDQTRISEVGDGMSRKVMRHSYKDSKRGHVRGEEPQNTDADIEELLEEIRRLKEENERLENENRIFRKELEMKGLEIEAVLEKNKELNFRVNMNSRNSSKPPSTDGYRKPSPKNRRVKSGLKRGGQPGHTGHNMVIPHEPDEIVIHHPQKCNGCQHFDECSKTNFSCGESRFVVDLVMTTKVTEHRVVGVLDCPLFKDGVDIGEFPKDVSAHIQYGNSVAALAGLLSTYGAISDSRISSLMRSMFGITLSASSVVNMVSRCAAKVAPALAKIKDEIINGRICHFDETGARTAGTLYWVHNSSTSNFTYQTISNKRGYDGIEENGVLKDFSGTAIHDCWKPYWRYTGASHALCNAHLLRELASIEDLEPEHRWPRLFLLMLLSMKLAKEQAQSEGDEMLPVSLLTEFDERYDRILRLADRECPPPDEVRGKKKTRVRKGKERALIERLRSNKDHVCLFIYDFEVPFDNNQAERDVRNVKTKIKVSGCFRSRKGGQDYLDIMSFLTTGRKHEVDAYMALTAAFSDHSDIVL